MLANLSTVAVIKREVGEEGRGGERRKERGERRGKEERRIIELD